MFYFEIGQRVKIKGLQNNFALNGCYGTIIRGLDQQQERYGVQIEQTEMVQAQQINIKPVNLLYIEPEKPNDIEKITNKLQQDINNKQNEVDSYTDDIIQTNLKIDDITKETQEVEKQMKYYEDLIKLQQQQLKDLK